MPEHSYTSRRELEHYHFTPLVSVLAPMVCLLLGAMLPRLWAPLAILDLPLIITVYFAVSRRSPVAGTLNGAAIGLLQDAFTDLPFGVNGIAKSIVGYIGSSLGYTLDVDNVLSRALINFFASLLQSGILYLITRRLLGDVTVHLQPVHELLRAGIDVVVALPVFAFLDRFRVLED